MASTNLPHRLWTDTEDDLLRAQYPLLTGAQLAVLLGRTPGAVRSRCVQLGLNTKHPLWTTAELEILENWYRARQNSLDFDLDEIAGIIGRRRADVCKKAGDLGLTISHRPTARGRASSSKNLKEWRNSNPHPCGALGMVHTPEARAKMGAKRKGWASRIPKAVVAERVARAQRTKLERYGVAGGAIGCTNPYSRAKRGRRADLGDQFFRSSWEANYARYLNFLLARGEIQSWEYEPQVFVFHGVTRGAITYTPDFKVVENDGTYAWHEVKGWLDGKSKTKLRRMAEFYPLERVILIDQKQYKSVAKYAALISGWE